MMYLGDLAEDQSITFRWNTNDGEGASITRATDGTIKVIRDDGTDCTGTAVTDTEDTPDTGIHTCTIDTSDSANFAIAHDYDVWLDGAVIDGATVNAALAHFSIENRYHPITEAQAGYLTAAVATAAELAKVPKSDSNVTWNATAAAQIQSEANDALVANNLDHLCLTATAGADMTTEVADNTIISRMLANGDTSVFDPSTDGLQPIRDRGDVAWITATGFSTHAAADVWSVGTREITGGTVDTCTTNTDMRGTDGANTTVPDAAGTAASLLSALESHGDAAWVTGSGSGQNITVELTDAIIIDDDD